MADRLTKITTALGVLAGPTHHQASGPDEHRPYVRHLFELVVRCVHEGHTEPIIASSQLRQSSTSEPNHRTMSR